MSNPNYPSNGQPPRPQGQYPNQGQPPYQGRRPYQGQPPRPGQYPNQGQYPPGYYPGQVPPGGASPATPPKKSHGCLIAAIIVAVLLLAIVGGCAVMVHSAGKAVSDVANAEHKVTFKVTTTTKASIDYSSLSGSSHEQTATDWSKDITAKGPNGVMLQVTSTDPTATDAKVTCEIIVDGVSQVQNTGSGAGASASCSAHT